MKRPRLMTLVVGFFSPVALIAEVQIPLGFEVVGVSYGDYYHERPRMNDCGEVVFNTAVIGALDDTAELWLFDNGHLASLTDNQRFDVYPDINNEGTIVWAQGLYNIISEIWIADQSSVRKLGEGTGGGINNNGDCVWSLTDEQTCAYETAVFKYENGEMSQVSDFELANQSARINDLGQIVWTRYDFTSCGLFDWTSKIMLYENGNIIDLPSAQDTPQSPDINNHGQVVWGNFDYIEMYSDGITVTLSEGTAATINDLGDVAFSRWHPYWHAWVYLDGEFYQLSEGELHNSRLDINNDREVVWRQHPNGDLHPSSVFYMRRIRNGDVNFDREVDLVDHASFALCATGPGDFARLCRCRFADMQHDRDVDLADIALFQNTFHHLQLPGHECCDFSHGPGCNDASVESCVCAVAPDCCETNWSESCTVLVELLNCGTCP